MDGHRAARERRLVRDEHVLAAATVLADGRDEIPAFQRGQQLVYWFGVNATGRVDRNGEVER